MTSASRDEEWGTGAVRRSCTLLSRNASAHALGVAPGASNTWGA